MFSGRVRIEDDLGGNKLVSCILKKCFLVWRDGLCEYTTYFRTHAREAYGRVGITPRRAW